MVLESIRQSIRCIALIIIFLVSSWACAPSAFCQSEYRPFQDPPEGPRSVDREVELNLTVGYSYVPIFNPVNSVTNLLRVRTYNGALVGPTIRVKPGERLKVNLTNALPAGPMGNEPPNMNVPHDFNVTNLHTHGLHVSPQGNSDNVFLSIAPGASFTYLFDVPNDHPASTFWYHAHRHGSTALQVSSGMAGALIVTGAQELRPSLSGRMDIDALFKDLPDRIWMFQQIPYSCSGNLALSSCKQSDIGEVEDYDGRFGPGAWQNSGHLTTVNGEMVPALQVRTGQIERWRLIHGGVRETLQVKISPCDLPDAFGTGSGTLESAMSSIDKAGPTVLPVSQWEFATDGLTRSDIREKSINVLQPGYRSDVLVQFARPGTYCVLDDADLTGPTSKSTVDAEAETRKLLAIVRASGPPVAPISRTTLVSDLVAMHPQLPAPVISDLRNLNIARFAGQADSRGQKIDGTQTLAFAVDVRPNPNVFMIDDTSYDPTQVPRTLRLNHLDEWTLTSYFGSHPFHIHTNPFEVVSITTAKGKLITDSECPADDDGDPQYCGMVGTWRDTLFIKQGYKVVIRSRYTDFIGDIVIHCHILDHEDQGMMQNVRILP